MVLFAISDRRQRQTPPDKVSGDKFPVKLEVEDSLEDEHGTFNKKQKHFSSLDQSNAGSNMFVAQPSEYNPLDEPSPLGLRLRKSPSLLELVQMRLSQGNSTTLESTPSDDFKLREKINNKGNSTSCTTDKLKASNFPASLLKIGGWQYVSCYEGDLVGKCYFAKHKIVWEILDRGLKSKIELQWSDIMGLKADFPDDAPATLIVVLSRQPLFFRETNPQPRKHTLWQATTDFTNGQASLHRKHFLEVPHGLLNRHFEKLIQCDVRLNFLSRQPEISMDSPYFEAQPSVLSDSNESRNRSLDQRDTSKGPCISIFEDIATPSMSQSSSVSIKLEDTLQGSAEILSREATSPSSVVDMRVTEARTSGESGKLKNSESFEQLVMAGIHPSMSMSDLVNHIENCISGQKNSEVSTSENGSDQRKMLEDIAQHLLGEFTPCSDEKFLMSRVNSLCSLLQNDGMPILSFEVPEDGIDARNDLHENHDPKFTDLHTAKGDSSVPDGGHRDASGCKPSPSMPRIDSYGDLLMHLPRIASLPKFLFDISEDGDNQAR